MATGGRFPDFKIATTTGITSLYNELGDSWGIIFSYPENFTSISIKDVPRILQLDTDFGNRGVKMMSFAYDSVEAHEEWLNEIRVFAECTSEGFPYPITSNKNCKFMSLLQKDIEAEVSCGIPKIGEGFFLVDPTKTIKLSIFHAVNTINTLEDILNVINILK